MTTVLTRMVARALLAPVLAVAAAILIKGYADVGDGFAAGIVAALGILLQYAAFGRAAVAGSLPVARAPVLALAGLALAVAVALVPALRGRALLEHVPGAEEAVIHVGTLELITPVAFDLGVFALVLGSAVAIVDMVAATEEEEEEDE